MYKFEIFFRKKFSKEKIFFRKKGTDTLLRGVISRYT